MYVKNCCWPLSSSHLVINKKLRRWKNRYLLNIKMNYSLLSERKERQSYFEVRTILNREKTKIVGEKWYLRILPGKIWRGLFSRSLDTAEQKNFIVFDVIFVKLDQVFCGFTHSTREDREKSRFRLLAILNTKIEFFTSVPLIFSLRKYLIDTAWFTQFLLLITKLISIQEFCTRCIPYENKKKMSSNRWNFEVQNYYTTKFVSRQVNSIYSKTSRYRATVVRIPNSRVAYMETFEESLINLTDKRRFDGSKGLSVFAYVTIPTGITLSACTPNKWLIRWISVLQ